MIGVGDIVTVKEAKDHPLIPFKPGQILRVSRVSKYKTDKKRIAVEDIEKTKVFELYPSSLRKVDMLEVNGKLRSLEEWSRDVGITVSAMKDRLRYGWTPEDAVTVKKGGRAKS